MLIGGDVRCWGYGTNGQLGYGNTDTIGDNEVPGSVGPVSLGPGRTAKAIATGQFHTCALLDDGSVRCWGFGGDGRLGYGNTNNLGAIPSTTPDKVGAVDLGLGRTAKAITAGGGHTCAILDDGSVRCWGYGFNGQLGYGNTDSVGDDETPGSVGPVNLGPGRTAVAISAGGRHTCAILDDGSVRCWGFGADGALGYGNQNNIGDAPQSTPDTVGPVNLGSGRTAKAISAGDDHTCAVLDDGNLRCWGYGLQGRLGYGDQNAIGDNEAPAAAGPVDLGPGRTATAVSAGGSHTCAILDDGSVRCWGFGGAGQLGYGNTNNLGGTPATTPRKVGPVELGPGRTAIGISAGALHTCALLDNGAVRCWGDGANGRLGYCNQDNVGDTPATLPGKVGPVNLGPGNGGAGCATSGGGHVAPRQIEARRAHALRTCLAKAGRGGKRPPARARRACIERYGRTPGRITMVRARAVSGTKVVLFFSAPGTDGTNPPAARAYVIKQSARPIRGRRGPAAVQALCKGSCRFKVTLVGTKIKLMITHLRPHTTYYYEIAARDNVSGRLGTRSQTVEVRTR